MNWNCELYEFIMLAFLYNRKMLKIGTLEVVMQSSRLENWGCDSALLNLKCSLYYLLVIMPSLMHDSTNQFASIVFFLWHTSVRNCLTILFFLFFQVLQGRIEWHSSMVPGWQWQVTLCDLTYLVFSFSKPIFP